MQRKKKTKKKTVDQFQFRRRRRQRVSTWKQTDSLKAPTELVEIDFSVFVSQ